MRLSPRDLAEEPEVSLNESVSLISRDAAEPVLQTRQAIGTCSRPMAGDTMAKASEA